MAEKRLRKSEDKKILGVCGGIAEYFNIDPTVIRVLWAVVSLFYGVGVFLYIVLAFVLPQPESAPAARDEDDIVVEVADQPEDDRPEL